MTSVMNDATPRCAVPGSACRLLQLETLGTRPVWAVLDAAGARHFTGEIVLRTEPEVVVHFTAGEAYLAERRGDAPLGERLVDLGVLTADELEQGTVRLGAIAHLGRLFDRLPDLDRDRVELALEVITGEVLGEIADHPVDAIDIASYRHHPSGVHRWLRKPSFVLTQAEQDASQAEPEPEATASDIAMGTEYERLLAGVPPVDEYAPTMALPVIEPATESDLTSPLPELVPAEPEGESADWAVETPFAWPDDLMAPEPEPEPTPEADIEIEPEIEPVAIEVEAAAEPAAIEPVAGVERPNVLTEPSIIWDLPIDAGPDLALPAPDPAAPDLAGLDLPAFDLPGLELAGLDPAPDAPEAAVAELPAPPAPAPAPAPAPSGGLEMPAFDLASLLQQVARDSDGAIPPPDHEDDAVDDDVRAAVRAALAEIEAATRSDLDLPSSPAPADTPTVGEAGAPPVVPMPYLPDARPAGPAAIEPATVDSSAADADLPPLPPLPLPDGTDDDGILDLTPPPRSEDQPTGGLRRLIGGIRKP